MHLTILSRGTGVHTTKRLVEAAAALGHKSRVVDPARVLMGLGTNGPQLFLDDKPFGRTDCVIPRIAQSMTAYGLALVSQFDISGVAVLNDSEAIGHARNKMRLMQLLVGQGIAVPPTVIGRGALELKQMVDQVGGFPVAIKLVQASERFGIIICESAQSMAAVAEAILSMGHDIIVQRYLSTKEGRDLRALVVGGEVIAAVRRRPTAGKLRHSLVTGADVTRTRLTAAQTQMALDAARVVGLEVAAVDMLDLKGGGTQVFEVHSSPGLRELESASGEDLARPIVQRAVQIAKTRRQLAALQRKAPRTPGGKSR